MEEGKEIEKRQGEQDREEGSGDTSGASDASSLLNTLDKFALRAFNASLGLIEKGSNMSE